MPWLLKHKPTILLSFHVFAYLTDTAAHEELTEIIWSYTHTRWSNGHVIDRKGFTLSGWCRLCAMILTEQDLTIEDGMLNEGVGSA